MNWYHFKAEVSQNGSIKEVGMWVREATVLDAQNVANRRSESFLGTTNRVKFCHAGYYELCGTGSG